MLTTNSKLRKGTPIYSGVLKYFPLALAAIARVSKAGNDKHNPGEPLHWSREKSNDHLDCTARHLATFHEIDPENGQPHGANGAWRMLAELELFEEKRLAMDVDAGAANTTVGFTAGAIGVAWGDPYTGSDVTNACAMEPPPPPPFTYWYLATPYSKYPAGHDAAFTMAAMMAARVMEARVPVFAPIAHSHPVSKHTRVSNTDHDFWIKADAPFIELASGLIVVTAEGWEESRGMAEEIKRFTAAGKPVVYWAPWCRVPRTILDTAK